MAKAKTIAELEAEISKVEDLLYEEENLVDNLDEVIGGLEVIKKNKVGRHLVQDEQLKELKAERRAHNSRIKSLAKKYDKLEVQMRELRSKDCEHKNLKCADCGKAIAKT